ncbi:MAG: class I SAM-dependent methyltransferase [Saprospiraceae bacterium]
MNKIKFFRESIKNLKTVGTITRSSKFLCKGMIEPVDFKKANVIVELGAGDGVVTEHILNALKPGGKLLAFEVNEEFCNQIRNKFKGDDRLIVVEESAANIADILKAHNIDKADYVISAIPFVSLPDELGYEIVNACKDILKPKGLYIQIHYSLLMKKMYKKVFGNVDVSFVPLNIPPAFVLVSEK